MKTMASSSITSWQRDEETVERVTDFIFLCSKVTSDGDCSCEIKRHLLLGRKVMTNLDSILKSRDITLPTKSSQSFGFSSGHVWMWELDYKESWAPKIWCFWTVVVEKTLESPLPPGGVEARWEALRWGQLACWGSMTNKDDQLGTGVIIQVRLQPGWAVRLWGPSLYLSESCHFSFILWW